MKAAQAMADDMSPEGTRESTEVLGLSGILKEAARLPFRNDKLVIFSIFLAVLLPLSFLSVFLHLTLPPLKKELNAADDDSSNLIKVIFILFGVEVAFFLIFYVTFLFGFIITVHHTIDTYMRKSISLKELFSRATTTWKRVVISWSSFFIGLAYILLVIYLMMAFGFLSASSATTKLSGLVDFVIAIYHVYHTVVWTLGYVISIAQECDQFKAIERARHLIGGRKVRAYLMLFLLQVGAPISLLLLLHLWDHDRAVIARYAMGGILVVFISISQLFIFVVFSVFYHEMKKSHGEKVPLEKVQIES